MVLEEKIDGKLEYSELGKSTVYWEFMKYTHNIYYNKLPAYRIFLDIWDGTKFLNFEKKSMFFGSAGLPLVRTIMYVNMRYKDFLEYVLPKVLEMKSEYGDSRIEGIVVKNYDKQLFGKVVNPEFEYEIDSTNHWMKKEKRLNRLKV